MKIDGRCHCGEITYEAEVDPDALSLCHCTDCQMISGSPFRANIPAPAPQFALRSGAPKSYIKTAESGNQRRQVFCGTCGTHLYACAVENPEIYMLRAGTTRNAPRSSRIARFGDGQRWIGWTRSPH